MISAFLYIYVLLFEVNLLHFVAIVFQFFLIVEKRVVDREAKNLLDLFKGDSCTLIR